MRRRRPGNRDMLPVVPPPIRHVSSRQHPLVARFRDAARRPGDTILLDGPHLVAEALASGVVVEVAAFQRDALGDPELLRLSGAPAIEDVVTVSDQVIDALSPTRSPSGVVALAQRPRIDPLAAGRRPPLVIVAVDVQDPGNMGAVVRSAEAGGATGVIATSGSADPFGWKALRGAMGSAFRLPSAASVDAREAMRSRRHVRRIAGRRHGERPRHPDGRGRPHADRSRSWSAARVLDCRTTSCSKADVLVSIPMAPRGRITQRGGGDCPDRLRSAPATGLN